jgi:ribonuclease D
VFDTQLAAGFTRCGGRIGLGDLVEGVLGVKMDKSEATSDWRVRPLSATQLDYAANDVRHMLELRARLLDELDAAGRGEWFADEMDMLLAETADPGPADAELWRSVRRARKLRESPAGVAVLRALAEWREQISRSVNMAPNLILSDDAIVQLATAPPASLADLGTLRAARGSTVRLHGRVILHTIQRAVEDAAMDAELGRPGPDLPIAWLANDPTDPASVKAASAAAAVQHRLLAMVYEKSVALTISHELMATPADVVELLDATPDEEDGVKVLQGWRRDVIGAELLEAKHAAERAR